MINEGTILIDTEGETLGQVTGIPVLPMADYSFGKPSRITARTHVGNAGVINIDRQIELGGRIHNKGVMILTGYLGEKFAQDIPLTFSTSITFEQIYEEAEGDSASSAELYALLSSLSGYPIRQDLAVTGSVNQHGQVQAVREGKFHIYPVSTIDEGIGLLTGIEAGERNMVSARYIIVCILALYTYTYLDV